MGNRDVPGEVLRYLAKKSYWGDRLDASMHKNTPADALEHLAHDDNEDIRWNVARHILAPASALKILADDKMWFVRHAAARHAHTSDYVLSKMMFMDEDFRVREAAAINLHERKENCVCRSEKS